MRNSEEGLFDAWESKTPSRAKRDVFAHLAETHERECTILPGFSTNVVVCCGIVLPKHVAWLMNGWLARKCEGGWKGTQLGFVTVDFATDGLIGSIIEVNQLT
jgi:hypothetical protein